MIKILFDWIGYASTFILLIGIVFGVWSWLTGILPVLLRLGNGLSKRKVALLVKGDNSLKSYLVSSKLLKKHNICEIKEIKQLHELAQCSLLVLDWKDWGAEIDEVLEKREDKPLLIYAPKGNIVPDEKLMKMDDKPHFLLSNFRGRLINDIVSTMTTTSYERNK